MISESVILLLAFYLTYRTQQHLRVPLVSTLQRHSAFLLDLLRRRVTQRLPALQISYCLTISPSSPHQIQIVSAPHLRPNPQVSALDVNLNTQIHLSHDFVVRLLLEQEPGAPTLRFVVDRRRACSVWCARAIPHRDRQA